MKFEVINYENNGWIFEKISKIIEEELKKKYEKLNKCKFERVIFHIHFDSVKNINENYLNIIFVTHIDNIRKKIKIINLSKKKNTLFFTMSNDTKLFLSEIINPSFIYSSNFFPNLKISKKKTYIFGFFFRNYEDGRKNNKLIENIIKIISESDNSKLIIYGSGFEKFINYNNVIIYDEKFHKSKYIKLLKKCDFIIATGRDEGYVSILDATDLNIKTIAINQGYHKDFALAKGSLLAENEKILLQILTSIINCSLKNKLINLGENLDLALRFNKSSFPSYKGNFIKKLIFLFQFNKFSYQPLVYQIKNLIAYHLKN